MVKSSHKTFWWRLRQVVVIGFYCSVAAVWIWFIALFVWLKLALNSE